MWKGKVVEAALYGRAMLPVPCVVDVPDLSAGSQQSATAVFPGGEVGPVGLLDGRPVWTDYKGRVGVGALVDVGGLSWLCVNNLGLRDP